MGMDKQVFVYEGIAHPVQCEKIRYYQDKRLTQRLRDKVPIMPLQLNRSQNNTVKLAPTDVSTPEPVLSTAQATAPEEDEMNLKHLAAAGVITATALTATACEPIKHLFAERNSAGEPIITGPEFDITKNPNAKQAYQLKVQIKDAPAGGLKHSHAWVGFDVENVKDCGYYIGWPFNGTVPDIFRSIAFPLTQLSPTEYEGTFYTDWGKDGDFFGKGTCHWRFRTVGASFRATGADGETAFVAMFDTQAPEDQVFAVNKPLTRFHLKEDYPTVAKIPNYSSTGIGDVNYFKPEEIFSITITVQEAQ